MHHRLEDIEADIAEAERLMTARRLTIAVKRSIGEETASDDRRLLRMMQAWMILHDQRQKVLESDLAEVAPEQSLNLFLSPRSVDPAQLAAR
jgi:hypothetical protein